MRTACLSLLGLLAACAPPPCQPMLSAELFFGLPGAGGPAESHVFDAFLDSNVTPRFPAGLTVLDGAGRWRAPDGQMTRQRSRLVRILAPPGPDTLARLQAIRTEYRARFDQHSVGLVLASSCAEF